MSYYLAEAPAFGPYVPGTTPLKLIANAINGVVGPVWFGDAGCRRVSDIPIVASGGVNGIRCDGVDDLWSSAADGLRGRILVPEPVSNRCIGGRARHLVFNAATTSVDMIAPNRNGVYLS